MLDEIVHVVGTVATVLLPFLEIGTVVAVLPYSR
jgi:hypothetical protein